MPDMQRRHLALFSQRPPRSAVAIAVALLCVAFAFVSVSTQAPHFYRDDPIAVEPDSRDASKAEPWDIGLMYELTVNLFYTQRAYKPSNTRARNINSIDEVPNSSWFTNRVGSMPVSAPDIIRGPEIGRPPAPGKWTIIREKSGGANPGFTAKDANGETWFLAFDIPENPEAATSAVVVATKLAWAMGYNQVETYLTTFDPKLATIDEGATVKRPNGKRTRFTRDDMDFVLEKVHRSPDGTYRAAAGRLLPGKVLGGFRYEGTRPDDPNDTVPHEHRRELRALRVFGAWIDLTDLKAGNTLDTLVTENGKSIVKHYLQDVGATFGTDNGPHEWDIGYEYLIQPNITRKRFFTFGFGLSPWQTVDYEEYKSLGLFEGDKFDPTTWKPQSPTTAILELRAGDAFWAARRVMAFDDDLIRAAVSTGKYSDPAAAKHLTDVLIKRRDKIGSTYLPAINPIVNPRLDAAGTLSFENAAVRFTGPPTAYRAAWSNFDNATGTARPIGTTQSPNMAIAAPAGLPTAVGSYVQVDLSADLPSHPSWQPIHVWFQRIAGGWKLVGLERLPQQITAAATK